MMKTAVITGISKGIGKALCELLLSKNYRVTGIGQHKPDIENEHLTFIKADVRNYIQVADAILQIKTNYNNQIDVLINNAGLGYFGNLEDMPIEQWHEMFDTNVDGVFYTCKEIIPIMKQQKSGHIINIASTAALEGMPQVSAYCASKWAVKGLTESLWRELRDYKIKVTCVYPGSTKTDFFRNSPGIKPHDYMLMPEDVAQMIVHAIETPPNFHQVNLEVRPLQPKGPKV
ncbi:MAG: SDR family NAD(P)-dependent oxidoreductase [Bacteroidota bacterium]|nr:SDR family NAD(P)-dependent oxidoreductase [Bacteroidota bacterium]